jgi:hypothetical protein
MDLSYRQAKRLWKRYQSKGAAGLVHGSAGGSSNRAKPTKVRTKVLRLIRQKYSGEVGQRFGPTLAAEHLASEDQIEISVTTVRRWMLAEGLWSHARKVREHRQRRARREHFGELVQLDGSFHEWLEGRGPRGCLRLARVLGPFRRFNLAHPKLLILRRGGLASPLYRSSRRSGGNVGIAERFPRAVGRVENLGLVFQAFHGPSFPRLSGQCVFAPFFCFSAVRRKRYDSVPVSRM